MFAKRERMKLGIKKNGRGTKKILQGRVGAQNPISKAHENTYFQSKKKSAATNISVHILLCIQESISIS